MSTFLSVLKKCRIDLTNSKLILLSGLGGVKSSIEVSPKTFLEIAKKDILEENERGLINGITNAKRAIDCQIEEVLDIYGIQIKKNDNQIKKFLEHFDFDNELSFKLKLIQSLDFAPAFLASKARKIRHNLEHDFKLPTYQKVKEAIDIADLFIRSIKGKNYIVENKFILTDESNMLRRSCKNGLHINFDSDEKRFSVTPSIENEEQETFYITAKDIEYLPLVRLLASIEDRFESEKSLKFLLHLIHHEMPKEKVSLTYG